MKILSQGHIYALYKDAEKTSWIGRLSYFEHSKEMIPFVINNNKLILELVIPEHFYDKTKSPKYYVINDGQYFLMRLNYREINIYKISENNFMDMITGDESTLFSAEFGPLFISTIRKALCYYVAKNPCTTQFIFEAYGDYGEFIAKTLTQKNDSLNHDYQINSIPDLVPPYYGFELDILSLVNIKH